MSTANHSSGRYYVTTSEAPWEFEECTAGNYSEGGVVVLCKENRFTVQPSYMLDGDGKDYFRKASRDMLSTRKRRYLAFQQFCVLFKLINSWCCQRDCAASETERDSFPSLFCLWEPLFQDAYSGTFRSNCHPDKDEVNG